MSKAYTGVILVAFCIWGLSETSGFDEFHGAKPVPRLNYDSLYAAATPLAESAAGRELLDNCLARYGGVEKLQKLESFRLAFRMKAFLNWDSVDVVKSFRRDRQYKISRSYPGSREFRILNRNQSWYQNADTTTTLSEVRYAAELFSYLTLAMPLAMTTERFDGRRYGRRDDDSLAYLYLEKQDSLMIVIGIDPRDHLIKSAEGVIPDGELEVVFINYFSDHRDHDGFLFFHRLTNISMGLEVARSVITSIEVNPEFDRAEFLPRETVDPNTVY